VTHFIAMRREFGAVSTLLVAIFTATFVVAGLIDVAGLLQWIGFISGLPLRILELGAAITAATVFPLLVMGMSISADLNHHNMG
jgi:hypothetical protein